MFHSLRRKELWAARCSSDEVVGPSEVSKTLSTTLRSRPYFAIFLQNLILAKHATCILQSQRLHTAVREQNAEAKIPYLSDRKPGCGSTDRYSHTQYKINVTYNYNQNFYIQSQFR